MTDSCVITGCARERYGRQDVCHMHYQRRRKHGDAELVPVRSFRRPVRERLFDNSRTLPSGCIVGTGKSKGYRLIQIENKTLLAHRVAYELEYGPIPEGLFVLHACDHRPCFNPKHLFLGNQADNMRDMVGKGRKVAHFRVRLTAEQAEAIRASSEPRRVLAERYGVTREHIGHIKSGRSWQTEPIF